MTRKGPLTPQQGQGASNPRTQRLLWLSVHPYKVSGRQAQHRRQPSWDERDPLAVTLGCQAKGQGKKKETVGESERAGQQPRLCTAQGQLAEGESRRPEIQVHTPLAEARVWAQDASARMGHAFLMFTKVPHRLKTS